MSRNEASQLLDKPVTRVCSCGKQFTVFRKRELKWQCTTCAGAKQRKRQALRERSDKVRFQSWPWETNATVSRRKELMTRKYY